MSENKAIDKANLELALSENNNRIKNYVSNRIHNVDIAQKTVNTELDYFNAMNISMADSLVSLPAGTISLTNFNDIKRNMDIIDNKYITLKANKTYNIKASMSVTNNTARYLYIITDDNVKLGGGRSGTANYNTMVIDIVYTPDKDTNIGLSITAASTMYSYAYSFTIQEIGRHTVVDPVEYINTQNGIEDTPVGHVMSCMSINAPKHYLICDGTEYNISDYPHLAQHFMNEFGKYNYFGGDGVNTFAVPTIISQVNVETNANVLESEQLVVKFEELTGYTDSVHISDMTITQNELESTKYFMKLTDKKYLALRKFKANVIGLVNSYKTATGGTTSEGAFYQYRNDVLIKTLFYKAPTNTIGSTGTAEDIFNFEEGDTFYFCTPSSNGWPQQYGTIEIYLNFTKYLHCIKYEPTYFYADTVQNNDPELEQIIGQLGLILDDINGEVV